MTDDGQRDALLAFAEHLGAQRIDEIRARFTDREDGFGRFRDRLVGDNGNVTEDDGENDA